MSPKSPRQPSYCVHKTRGQAYVRLNGVMVHLGPPNTDESRQRFHHATQVFQSHGKTISLCNEAFLICNAVVPRMNVIRFATDTLETLIEPFTTAYDGHSSCVHHVGPLAAANAHALAVALARHLFDLYHEHGTELLRDPHADELYTTSADEHLRLSDEWMKSTRTFRGRLLAVVGKDYEQEHQKHVAAVRLEAGRV